MRSEHRLTIIVIIAFVMAVMLAVINPLQLAAASKELYVSEIVVITEKERDKAIDDGYIVVVTPLYVNKLYDDAKSTYLAYKTTDKPEDAITDIRLMNMNGGFSFEEYQKLMESLRENAKITAAELWDAVVAFREAYKSENRPTNAKLAYDVLNVIYDDDVIGSDKQPMRLGDLFLDEKKLPDASSDTFITLFLESNTSVLHIIYLALAHACSRDENGQSFMDLIMEDPNEIIMQYADDDSLDSYVDSIYSSMADLRRQLVIYRDSDKKGSSFKDEKELNAYIESLKAANDENGTTMAGDWSDGYYMTELLNTFPYYGTDGSFDTLYDMFMMSDDAYKNTEYAYAQLRPLVGAMTPGLRCLLVIGISSLIKICATDESGYEASFNELKNDAEQNKMMEEGISAFYGIDRSMFTDDGIALTNAALRANANGNRDWTNTQTTELTEINNHLDNLHKWGNYLLYGFAGVSFLFADVIAMSYYVMQDTLISFTQEMADVILFRMWNVASAYTAVGFLFWGTIVVSIALLIVALVLRSKKGDVEIINMDYKQIPYRICDFRTTKDGTEEYIYYNGVSDPYGARGKAMVGGDSLPKNKHDIQDIYNWSLDGNRQWLCFYTTKDRRAGYPVKNGSLKIADKAAGLGAAMFGANYGQSYNLPTFYNASLLNYDGKHFSGRDGKEDSARYLLFEVDSNAKYEIDKTEQFLDKLTETLGSAVSSGAAWTMMAIGVVLGGFGGIVIDRGMKKTKKEEPED